MPEQVSEEAIVTCDQVQFHRESENSFRVSFLKEGQKVLEGEALEVAPGNTMTLSGLKVDIPVHLQAG